MENPVMEPVWEIELLDGFDFFTGGFPTGDAGGKVFHVGVAELFRFFHSGFVSVALRATAIGDDESILFLRELFGEFRAGFFEINGGRHVAFFVGITAVYIDDGDGFFLDGLFKIGDRDVRCGECGGGESKATDESD